MKWLLLLLFVAGAAAHGTLERPVWSSGPMEAGAAWSLNIGNSTSYHDGFSAAEGQIQVVPEASSGAHVEIVREGDEVRFEPAIVSVASGGTVMWHNSDDRLHSVESDETEAYEDEHVEGEDSPAGLLAVAALGAAAAWRRR